MSGAAKKASCRDDDTSMRAALRMTCAEMRGRGNCIMFKSKLLPTNYCECSCPAGTASTRVPRNLQSNAINQINFAQTATCPLESFNAELSTLNKACCDQGDSDDQCDSGGVPHTCDYECAFIFSPMFDRCEGLMRKLLGVRKMPAFVRLYHAHDARLAPTGRRLTKNKNTAAGVICVFQALRFLLPNAGATRCRPSLCSSRWAPRRAATRARTAG